MKDIKIMSVLRIRRITFLCMAALTFYVLFTYYLEQNAKIYRADAVKTRQHLENTLENLLKEDKGTGCAIPQLDPFADEIVQFEENVPNIYCIREDWVKCYFSKCKVEQKVLDIVGDEILCSYRDIIYVSDENYTLAPPVLLKGNKDYHLNKSDHVKINCSLTDLARKRFTAVPWVGHGIGFRPLKPDIPPPERDKTPNVLILAFDSVSKCAFIRKLPKTYKFIREELGAVVLNGYNIVGDGTPAAIFPILTGKTELELPECRKSIQKSGYLDDFPFLFYKLKKDGYRTAYFEDMPEVGTFQYRFNGFCHQPTDHYLRAFFLEESKTSGQLSETSDIIQFCVDGTPRFKIMLNITEQFFKLDGKRFAFTFIADITHGAFNMLSKADDPMVEFLKGLKQDSRLNDTLLIVMGDHGSRYDKVRGTLQGRLEERLPFMAIRLPEDLTAKRPKVASNLRHNMDTLTTPHDIHETILDVIDMREHWNPFKIKGADLTRGLTLLEQIPKNRSCSEAGVQPHWCVCTKWESMRPDNPIYNRTAQALVDFINKITDFQRAKCSLRTLTSIIWVTKKLINDKVMQYQGNIDGDGYVVKFGAPLAITKPMYQVKITAGPDNGAYEATVTHFLKEDRFHINARDISRTNAYKDEPRCIRDKYPHLNMYCYCKL